MGTQITALDKSLTDRISELKERIDRGEGQDRGQDRAIGSPYEASVFRQTEESARQAAQRAVIAQVARQHLRVDEGRLADLLPGYGEAAGQPALRLLRG